MNLYIALNITLPCLKKTIKEAAERYGEEIYDIIR